MCESDVAAIREVVLRCAQAVDRKDWAGVRACYHPDAYDEHGSYRGGVDGLIDDMRARHADSEHSSHAIANIVVDVEGDVAFGDSYCLAYLLTRGEGTWTELDVRCRYVDRFERRPEAGWRIAHRIVVYDAIRRTERAERPTFPDGYVVSRRDGDDPLYAIRRSTQTDPR